MYWYAVDLNKLDFDDIETNIRSGIDFIYAPQDSIGQLLNMNVLQGTSLTLTVTVGGANNSYQWTKNGVDIPGATDPIYTIASATSQDQGSYRCRITNTVATQLTLYSRVNSVTVPAPPCPGIPTVTYEGKTYNTVQIGTQCWLKENLNVGTKINGHDNQIDNGILEKYCYDDLESNCDIYGGLYQWNEMMQYVALEGTKGICPTGWHIPSDAEWCTITNLLDPTVNCNAWGYSGTEVAMKMKEPGLTHWCPPNTGANNSSGFTALPSGSLRNMEGFYFYGKMGTAFFWSSSQTYFFNGGGWGRLFSSDQTGITRTNIGGQSQGFSVRCIKDPCTSYSDVGVNIESSSNPVCEGSSVTFTATPINGGTEPVYQWQINGVNSGTNQSDFTYNPVNNDVVICILTSNASCINGNQATSNPVTMTVEPILPVDVVISASANQICAGTSVEFTAISTNGGTTPSFQWNVNGSPAGLNNPVFTYEPINTDVVTCVLTTSLNCTTGNPAISNAIIMTVNPELPVGIIIAASANPVCNNTSVTFTATPINGGAAPSYQWKVNGTNVGTSAATYSYTPANSDVVTCELTSNITPCATGNPATSNTLNMTVNPLPNATITVTPSNNIYTGGDPTRIYLGYGPQSVTLHASETGGTGFFYSWTSPTALGLAGLSCTNCANPVFSQTVEGRYILNLTITNSAGCSSSSSITICVMDIRVPNQNNKVYICHNQGNQQTLAVSVNAVPAHVPGHPGDFLGKCNQSCDNIAFKSDELAGDLIVSPDNSLSTIVYPNPFRSDFTLIVETESEEIIEANIYDLTGRLLQVIKDLKPNVPVIITNDLTDGFYILHISQGGHSQKVKIVKNR